MKINYLDLFSGIGGFALGIQQAGVKIDKCYFSEIDKYATQIYKRHFPDAIELGDIRTIKPETLGKIDLITFGFPCQDLSIAGKRKGLGGARSGLFFKAMWLISQLLPSVFIFENVKGLLTSNEGKDFEIVLRTIANIGLYECEWQLVNTSWVLPQNRERVYFIGHLGEGSGQKVFPIGASVKNHYEQEEELSMQISNTLRTNYSNGYANETYVMEISPCIRAEHHNTADVHFIRQPLKFLSRNQKNIEGDYAFTLDGANTGGVKQNNRIRRFTPTEGERLQGFPDGWTNKFSDNVRYKMIGNAVSVPIVKMIIERLYITPIMKKE